MSYKVKFDLPAGIKVKSNINNIEGIITSRVERINGCLQYHVSCSEPDKHDRFYFADLEDLTVLEEKLPKDKPVEFKFRTGDRVENLITGKIGIVTVRRVDKNGCIGYWFENGDQNPKDNSMIEYYSFEQELKFVDNGLNSEKIERKRTGCYNIQSSGKY